MRFVSLPVCSCQRYAWQLVRDLDQETCSEICALYQCKDCGRFGAHMMEAGIAIFWLFGAGYEAEAVQMVAKMDAAIFGPSLVAHASAERQRQKGLLELCLLVGQIARQKIADQLAEATGIDETYLLVKAIDREWNDQAAGHQAKEDQLFHKIPFALLREPKDGLVFRQDGYAWALIGA